MDKYTVDLDKVLNDFEYNELTIENQQDNVLVQSQTSVGSPYSSGNRLKTAAPTKHSINTVFKSLDDYVKSDIVAKSTTLPEQTEDNNVVVDIPKELIVNLETDKVVDVTISEGSDLDEEETLSEKLARLNQNDDQTPSETNLDLETSESESTETECVSLSNPIENVIINYEKANTEVPLTSYEVREVLIAERPREINVAPVGFDSAIDLDESELSQYLDDLEKELDVPDCTQTTESDVKVIEDVIPSIVEVDDEHNQRRDSMQDRPNSLDIVHSLGPTRECINLIGKPGSTPYNNVYVSKELHPPKTTELVEQNLSIEVETNKVEPQIKKTTKPPEYPPDGDNISCGSTVSSTVSSTSSAMSPTFSEASTNSVQSTESTDDAGAAAKSKAASSKNTDEDDRQKLLESEDTEKDSIEEKDKDDTENNDEGEELEDEEEEISAMDFIAENSTVSRHDPTSPATDNTVTTPPEPPSSLPTHHTAKPIIPPQMHSQEVLVQEPPPSYSTLTSSSTIPTSIHQMTSTPNSIHQDTVASQGQGLSDSGHGLSDSGQGQTDCSQGVASLTMFSGVPQEAMMPVLTAESANFVDDAVVSNSWLGRDQPVWIPDMEAQNCLHCDIKFTIIKRRHHCRACGLVLCSRCANCKFRLEYLGTEARVCTKCYEILVQLHPTLAPNTSTSSTNPTSGNPRQPNPNNPMDYCSTVPPPLQQQASGSSGSGSGGVSGAVGVGVPSVMVPVGVLKRTNGGSGGGGTSGGSKKSSKSVVFYDGIRPGSDLAHLDNDYTVPTATPPKGRGNINQPEISPITRSLIPSEPAGLPPRVTVYKSDISYTECSNSPNLIESLKNETVTFAVQKNLYVNVKIVNMSCCINKTAWCFSTEGLMSAGQDEIMIVLEMIDNEKVIPKDVFCHLNDIYLDALKGTTVGELAVSLHNSSNFLDSTSHGGFLYIRPSFQCLQNLIIPKELYLIGILIHRWETPWAKNFPLRLVLRLGAECRYYPSPIISTRHRDSVYAEIGHTIINILADFRNFSYSLPHIRGLSIIMEDRKTTINIPVDRYDQVMKSLNNSSEHILAFGGNFTSDADSHLVCIQNINGTSENTYSTHAININHKPRKITGASFIVFNGALKSNSGLTAKSNIIEDGLMIQIPPEDMVRLRENLRQMRDHVIKCGPVPGSAAAAPSVATAAAAGGDSGAVAVATAEETVHLKWGDPDVHFNIGVKSLIDDTPMSGIPSIRVHQGKDYICNNRNRLIRWTEVFILQNGEENTKNSEPIDISKLASDIARATCTALVKYLDLLASNNFYKVGIRTNLHVENVSYSAGSNGIKLPPIYMKSLDNELIPVLHTITSSSSYSSAVILELVFRILNV